jgi:two-component system, NarL family, invasion response regulator UvrY
VVAATLRVLIGDDHRIVREGLKQILADAPDVRVVAEAQTGPEVLAQVAALQDTGGLDLVLLDIALPGIDGLDVLQQLKRDAPEAAGADAQHLPREAVRGALHQAGASGYLNKSADPDDMLAAVRKVAAGGVFLTPATAEALATAVGQGSAQAGPEALSHREHQVYRLLTQGQTVSEIGAQLGLAPNTVSTYRARILEKTGTKNDVELALYAERHARTRPGG